MKLSGQTIFLVILTFASLPSIGQKRYWVGDQVSRPGQVEILTTKQITGPLVIFIEEGFSVTVSKVDLMQATKETAALFKKDDTVMLDDMNRILNYINTSGNLTFKNIWTKNDEKYDHSWGDINDVRTLTEKYLREGICSIIESKRLTIKIKSEVIDKFYMTGINTKFGYANGVFTTNDKLIWICPPFTID